MLKFNCTLIHHIARATNVFRVLVLNRAFAQKGSKTVFDKRHDMNKVAHSYTAQYALTLFGKLLS